VGKVSLTDARLEPFTGNRDPEAHVIEKRSFLPLLEWLEASCIQLQLSGLDETLHVRKLVMSLSGAAQRAFTAKYLSRMPEVMTWTLHEARTEIASLVPDYKVQFTKQAIAMTFKAKSLQNDLQRFALYLQHGDMPVDGSIFVFESLQDKLLECAPNLFTIAQSSYNLRFEFKPTFEAVVADAMAIVNTLTTHNRLGLMQEGTDQQKEARATLGANPRAHKFGKKRGKNEEREKVVETNQMEFL
jgi:uncharacterized protein YxjI